MKSLFQTVDRTTGFGKVGVMGFQGSGKSYTSALIAIGLVLHMRERGLELGNKPVYFVDTEQGSDWLVPMFKANDIELRVARTRAFSDLLMMLDDAEANASVLLIDSVTHFWRDLTESYQRRMKRTSLRFEDWGTIKPEWARFSDRYVTSNLNIVMAGRAGWEYDFFTDDETQKRELEKTGIKMKAEAEMGYEPSLLILMERIQTVTNDRIAKQVRRATVLKDRSDTLDGKEFDDPTFESFLPHFSLLTFDAQPAVDTSRNSEDRFKSDGMPQWKWRKEQHAIALDEIAELLRKHFPGQGADDKKKRAEVLEKYFGTLSWARVETLPLETLQAGRNALWMQLEGKPYVFAPPDNKPTTDQQEASSAG